MLQLFFNWKGRINRQTYILAILGVSFCVSILPLLLLRQGADASSTLASMPIYQIAIYIVIQILATYTYIILMIKRIHDLDASGWDTVIGLLIMLIIPLLSLILWFQPGTYGRNSHGENTRSHKPRFFEGVSVRPEFQD
jgi:uncharacterized membrane protein YhaH (DUF805 family)